MPYNTKTISQFSGTELSLISLGFTPRETGNISLECRHLFFNEREVLLWLAEYMGKLDFPGYWSLRKKCRILFEKHGIEEL